MHSVTGYREHYPALQNKAYLNFGGQGVMARETLDTIARTYELTQREGPFSMKMIDWSIEEVRSTREAVATFFGTRLERIAITQNATEGCNIVLWGIDWNPGDRLLTTDCEHVGVMAAMQQLCRRRGVHLDVVEVRHKSDEEIVAAFANSMQDTTRMVLISHVLWNTGQVLPVAEIQKTCRSRDVILMIDGAQSAGIIPLNLDKEDYDTYAMPAHKWLCGPEGLGCLYIKPELLAKLQPTFVGWRGHLFSAPDSANIENFEVATAPFPLFTAWRAALETHKRAGSDADRHALAMKNVARARGELSKINGVHVITPADSTAGLVCFTVDGATSADIVKSMEQQMILLRTISDPDCVRASVHYLNNDEDVGRMTAALAAAKNI